MGFLTDIANQIRGSVPVAEITETTDRAAESLIRSFEDWGAVSKDRCFALHGMFLRDLQKDPEEYADIFDILLWIYSYAKLIEADKLGDEHEILTYTNDYYLHRAALLEMLKKNVKLFEYMQRTRDRRGNLD